MPDMRYYSAGIVIVGIGRSSVMEKPLSQSVHFLLAKSEAEHPQENLLMAALKA